MNWLKLPEQTIKPVVSFLLNRYVGELLLGKVHRDQLQIDLTNSTGALNDVNLNVQYINDALRKSDVPLELIDGYVQSIVVQVPFMKVLEDSCTIEVTGLEMTVQPRPHASGDLVTSMFESMVGSMTTSMELARSFVEEQGSNFSLDSDDQQQNTEQMKGIDALAKLIEIVLSRMKIVFHDTVVRIEHFPGGYDQLGVALEMNIQKLEFLDELLVDAESAANGPITSQPSSIGGVGSSDVCKFVRVHGLRLSTDVFSKPADMLCKSVYLRSSRRTTETMSTSSCPPTDQSMYQSISSFATAPTTPLTPGGGYIPSKPLEFARFASERMHVKIKLKNSAPNSNNAVGNAIIGGGAPKMENVDVEMFLGTLNVFLTPTQVHLLIALARAMVPDVDKPDQSGLLSTMNKDKPMQADDFAKVEWDLKQNMDEAAARSRLPAGLGNWSGEDAFYATSRFPGANGGKMTMDTSSAQFTSIAISSDGPGPDLLEPCQWKSSNQNYPSSVRRKQSQTNEKPETTHCKIQFSSVWLTLTHEDLLSTGTSSTPNPIESLGEVIAKYFQTAGRTPLAAGTVLQEVRRKCDAAYDKDHLRLIACPLVLEYTGQRSKTSPSIPSSSSRQSVADNTTSVQLRISAGNCELLECLSRQSVWDSSTSAGNSNSNSSNNANGPMEHGELLAFDRESEVDADKPDLTFKLTRDAQRYACSIALRPCRTEFDVSLIDRLCNLLFCQPSFKNGAKQQTTSTTMKMSNNKNNRYLFELPPANDLSLRDDLFEPLERTKGGADVLDTVSLDVTCSQWMLDLRFPIPDMRTCGDRRPWYVRHVRPEILRLDLDRVKLSTVFNAQTSKQGRVGLEFKKGTGYFKMDTSDGDFRKFLYACSIGNGSSARMCSIEIKWDSIGRSLLDEASEQHAASTTLTHDPNASMNNGYSSGESSSNLERHCFKIGSTLDGPFSKRAVVHENEQLTIVGNKEEINEFRRACLRRCEMAVRITTPELRVHLPGKEFFTVLYNRLANDIPLWTPCGPGFQSSDSSSSTNNFNVRVTGLGLDDDLFAPCKSMHKFVDDTSSSIISESELSDDRTLNGSDGSPKKKSPSKSSNSNREAHKFTFLIQSEKLDGVIGMPVKDEPNSTGLLKLSSEYAELFVVSGYDGDRNTVYFYLTTKALALWHNVLNSNVVQMAEEETKLLDVEAGFENNSGSSSEDPFHLHCIAEPTPLKLALRNEPGDNFTVALRSCLDPKQNVKDLLVALGFRNTTVHYRVHPPEHYWLMQLIELFDVTDEQVAGFDPPATMTELHVHGWAMSAEYRPPPTTTSTSSSQSLRLYVDSMDVSSNLIKESDTFRLHFILEDSGVFLAANSNNSRGKSSNLDSLPLSSYVCVARMGFFELTVTSCEPKEDDGDTSTPTKNHRPLLQVHARNDVLDVRTCADSLAVLTRLVQHLADEGRGVGSMGSSLASGGGHGSPSKEPSIVIATGQQPRLVPLDSTVGNGHQRMSIAEEEDEDKLRDMMASAMEDAVVPPARTLVQSSAIVEDPRSIAAAQKAQLLAKVKPPEPVVRVLNSSDGPTRIVESHFRPVSRRTDVATGLPPGYPTPLVQYLFRDISVAWHMYGGSDFGDGNAEYKSYSGVQGAKCSPKVNQRFYEAKESLYTAGGTQRDHSVCVSLHLNKICFLHELFPPGHAQIAREVITVQDVEIHDLLTVSNINKLLYQYAADQNPRQTYVPMVCVKVLHVVPQDAKEGEPIDNECCLKVSILPLRLNVDQDTLQFLQDFGKECGDTLDNHNNQSPHNRPTPRRHRVSSSSAHPPPPVMKIPNATGQPQQSAAARSPPPIIDPIDQAPIVRQSIDPIDNPTSSTMINTEYSIDRRPTSGRMELLDEATRDTPTHDSSASTAFYSQTDDDQHQKSIDLMMMESADEDQLCLDLYAPPDFAGELDRLERSSGSGPSPTIDQQPAAAPRSIRFSRSSSTNSNDDQEDDEIEDESDQLDEQGLSERDVIKLFTAGTPAVISTNGGVGGDGGLYFKSFTFAPELILRIDYHGKRIQTEQGAVVGLLLGLSQLHCTELRLKELNHRHGLLGFDKVVNHALMEWLRDIRRNQLYNIVGGVGPMHSLVQIALGIRDLFWLPVDQYRRDGHIVKGLQRGAQSFGLSTATATLELGQKFFGAIQYMAEFAFDIVNPDYHSHRSQAEILQAFAQPADFREGVALAVNAFRRGFSETAQAIVSATQEERASGRWAIRGVLRQATPTALRPVLMLSQASTHVLGGLRNQLRPDTRREEREKWKPNE